MNLLVKISTTASLVSNLYLDREKTGDITFVVGSERIPAHRSVLAASSPKYKAQFYGSQPDEGDVYVEDVSAECFKEFIKFLYMGEADLTLENLEEVLNLAKQCLVTQFDTKCEMFLKDLISESNVCWIYKFAIIYNLKIVQSLCEHTIAENVKQVFANEEFLDIDRDTLIRIIDLEYLKCSEFIVVKGCIKWAETKCNQKGVDDRNGENLRAQLGNAVSKIRFRSMKLCDFVKLYVTYPGFFSDAEFIEITTIISGLVELTSQKFNKTLRKELPTDDIPTDRRKFEPRLLGGSTCKHRESQTRLQCITGMREYEQESLEELRWVDYLSGRNDGGV